jgi:hypothetical protein
MNSNYWVIVAFISIIAASYWYYINYWIYTEVVINGESYNVLNGDKKAAAKLADLHETIIGFLGRLKKKYHVGMTTEENTGAQIIDSYGTVAGHDPASIVEAIVYGYNPEKVYENDPLNLSGTTSYTVQKGRAMYVCMRDKDNSFVEKNTMLFVLLHELSHIGAYWTFGHTTDFWKTFKFILKEAIDDGVYKYIDYSQNPVNYCGMVIKNSPYSQ